MLFLPKCRRLLTRLAVAAGLAVLIATLGLSAAAGANVDQHSETPEPTCSSIGSAMACVYAWSNGITVDYTGIGGPPIPGQNVVASLVGGEATVHRSASCTTSDFALFVPLLPGEWVGSSTLRTGPTSADNDFSYDLVVGAPGSGLAPATPCPNDLAPGSTTGAVDPPVVGIAPSPDDIGYWLVGSDGSVKGFGDAVSLSAYGYNDGAIPSLNAPIVGVAATWDGSGYWLAAADGGVFSYGDASFYGSMGGTHLNAPVVGIAATPDSKGYWLVAADGGVFSFGDASYHGSMGGAHLNAPVVGMASTRDGLGYYLVALAWIHRSAIADGLCGGVTIRGKCPLSWEDVTR